MEYNEQEKEAMKGTKGTEDLLDETEDEEVKRNCYGMKFYTSSCESEDDDDDDDDDDDTSTDDNDSSSTLSTCTESDLSSSDEMDESCHQPTKFTFDLSSKCEPGIIICRPKPLPFRKRINDYSPPTDQEEEEEDFSAHSTDLEDGTEEGVERKSDVVSKLDVFDDSSSALSIGSESSSSVEDEEVSSDQDARASSSFYNDDDASVSDNADDDELELGEEDSTDEESAQDDDDEDDEDDGGEESVASPLEGEGSESSTASESSIIEVRVDEQGSSQNERKEAEIEIEWDEFLKQKLDFGINHDNQDASAEASQSETASSPEGSSISTEDIENIMHDDEEDQPSDMPLSGYTSDHDDQNAARSLGQTKETEEESSPTLTNEDLGRQKQSPSVSHKRSHTTAFGPSPNTRFPIMTSLNTDLSAISNFEFFKRVKSSCSALTACNSEDDVDSQLAEELLRGDSPTSLESKPIPLLTPPASPMPIKSDESVVEIYEWPSGLVVDNAITAAIQLRPLSPSSLARLEEDDQSNEPLVTVYPRKIRTVTRDFSCPGDIGFTSVL